MIIVENGCQVFDRGIFASSRFRGECVRAQPFVEAQEISFALVGDPFGQNCANIFEIASVVLILVCLLLNATSCIMILRSRGYFAKKIHVITSSMPTRPQTAPSDHFLSRPGTTFTVHHPTRPSTANPTRRIASGKSFLGMTSDSPTSRPGTGISLQLNPEILEGLDELDEASSIRPMTAQARFQILQQSILSRISRRVRSASAKIRPMTQ